MTFDKRMKAVGRQIICPKCKNGSGLEVDFSSNPEVFTCPSCQTRFDSDGNTGPFEVVCSQCKQKQPFKNAKCFFCKGDLTEDKKALEDTGNAADENR